MAVRLEESIGLFIYETTFTDENRTTSSQIVSWIIYPTWNQPSFNNPYGRPEASKLPEAPVGQDPHGQ